MSLIHHFKYLFDTNRKYKVWLSKYSVQMQPWPRHPEKHWNTEKNAQLWDPYLLIRYAQGILHYLFCEIPFIFQYIKLKNQNFSVGYASNIFIWVFLWSLGHAYTEIMGPKAGHFFLYFSASRDTVKSLWISWSRILSFIHFNVWSRKRGNIT